MQKKGGPFPVTNSYHPVRLIPSGVFACQTRRLSQFGSRAANSVRPGTDWSSEVNAQGDGIGQKPDCCGSLLPNLVSHGGERGRSVRIISVECFLVANRPTKFDDRDSILPSERKQKSSFVGLTNCIKQRSDVDLSHCLKNSCRTNQESDEVRQKITTAARDLASGEANLTRYVSERLMLCRSLSPMRGMARPTHEMSHDEDLSAAAAANGMDVVFCFPVKSGSDQLGIR